MPDLSRFTALAAKSGVVPPCSTAPLIPVEQNFPCKINAVPPVPPVPPRNDNAAPVFLHSPACNTCNTVSPNQVLQKKHNENRIVAPVTPVTPEISDAEAYASALREIGPCGYGPVAVFLGWGVTRAANAETELRQAGRIVYDGTGRGRAVE